MGPKINLFNNGWIDTVFETRNKSYGAYVLRKENGKVSLKAFVIGSILFSLLVGAPVLAKVFGGDRKVKEDTTLQEKIVLADIQLPEEVIVEPVVEKQVTSIVEVVKHVPPVIVEKEEVEVEMKSVDDFKDKITGSDNVEADDDGVVVIEDVKIAEDKVIVDAVYNFAAVEVKPEYPGGIEEFYKYVRRNFRVPEVNEEINGLVIVNFVVEPDGSLSNITVARDLGHGTGREAVRLLNNAQKWKPGVQNGRNVRVNYTLPIRLNFGL